MMKAPRRGLRFAKFRLLLLLLVGFLLPDVFATCFFGQTDRAHALPVCREAIARKVPLPPQILAMDPDRRLPFQAMVGARGFEPPTPRSRTECSTRLSHAPTQSALYPRQP